MFILFYVYVSSVLYVCIFYVMLFYISIASYIII